MNDSLPGSQIAKLRKELGMTQEELGKRVGVSTQAVSRWECGGAPDISLLPAIADTLHVPIDALFGREGGEVEDIEGTLLRWTKALPRERFWKRLLEVLTPVCFSASFGEGNMPRIDPPENCFMTLEGEERLAKSSIFTDDGYVLASYAKDMQFLSIFPEPDAGYEAFFADHDKYCRLFATLAEPDVLELLLALYRETPRLFSAAAVAKRLALSEEKAADALRKLHKTGILEHYTTELDSGPADVYAIQIELPLIPFLIEARYLLQGECFNYIMLGPRTAPWLRKPDQKGENDHEKQEKRSERPE